MLVAVTGALYWFLSVDAATQAPVEFPAVSTVSGEATPHSANPQMQIGSGHEAFLAAFQTPISFWGKVIDEQGNAVGDVVVVLTANNRPDGKGTNYQRSTDDKGLFSITGIHGMSLHVEVSKEGYYQTVESRGGTIYGTRGTSDRSVPTEDSPTIFILRRKGESAQLYVSERLIRMRKDGATVALSLETGKSVPAGQGHLLVECWTEDQEKDGQGHYSWRCRLSVPGGGLIKRVGEYDFLAPADGYQPHNDITPPKEKWSAEAEREYFVRTADNRYARIKLSLQTRGDHFLVIESHFNPQQGDRNLEYDSRKQGPETLKPSIRRKTGQAEAVQPAP